MSQPAPEGSSSGAKRSKWFSSRIYAATFGRYETTGRVEFPYNEALVGRARERAKFITTLFSSGGKGSYLVTGHRGSGKSTFVDYCLEVYRRGVFERYLRANVGRAFFWDRIGLLGLVFVLAGFGVLLHESLYNLVQPGGGRSLFVWALTIGLTLLAALPLVAAAERLQLVADRLLDRLRFARPKTPTQSGQTQQGLWDRLRVWGTKVLFSIQSLLVSERPNIWPFIGLAGVTFVVWFFLPWGDPHLGLAQVALLLAVCFFVAGLLGAAGCRRLKNVLGFALAAMLIGVLELLSVEPRDAQFYWMLTFLCLGFSLSQLAIWNFLVYSFGLRSRDRSARRRSSENRVRQSLDTVLSAATWHLYGAIACFLAAVIVYHHSTAPHQLFVPLATLATALALSFLLTSVFKKPPGKDKERLAAFRRWMRHETRDDKEELDDDLLESDRALINAAQGDWQLQNLLLLSKALLLILISSQLLFPVVQAALTHTRWEPVEGLMHWAEGFSWSADDTLIGRAWADHPTVDMPKAPFAQGRRPSFWRSEAVAWMFGLTLVLLVVAFLEYEWIVRPGQHSRLDRPLFEGFDSKPGGGFEKQPAEAVSARRMFLQRLFEQTFFYSIYDTWLPLIIVPVNLGFDKLDHRRVVEAMLTGLRARYEDTFFGLGRYNYFLLRGALLIVVISLLSAAAAFWFALAPDQRQVLTERQYCAKYVPESTAETGQLSIEGAGIDSLMVVSAPDDSSPSPWTPTRSPHAMALACHLGGETLAQALQWPVLGDIRSQDAGAPRCEDEQGDRRGCDSGVVFSRLFPEVATTGYFVIRGYHLVMAIVAYWLIFVYLRSSTIFPYQNNLRRIDDLLQSLSSSLREEPRGDAPLISRVVSVFTGSEKVKHWESGPFDPRTVEISVLRILEDLQSPMVRFPFMVGNRLNLPVPEIVFRFDELDKLGLGVIPEHETVVAGPEKGDELSREARRTQALHSLFADLKNLLSSGAARFIFIGGRNLHDEWLADQTARHPLLSNIFENELYLPSLLTGGLDENPDKPLSGQVRDYYYQTYRRAFLLNQRSLLRRYRPWLTPWLEERDEPIFADEHSFSKRAQREGKKHEGAGSEDERGRRPQLTWVGRGEPLAPHWKDAFEYDFLQFLSYRSLGNLKRLKSFLESFIQPADRVLKVGGSQHSHVDCRHVLQFRDEDRFRIQLIAEIYRRVVASFHPRMLYRDDKLVVGIFYLSDFLLKFHRRAFAWSGLQRVDELVNIHRAPDLPHALSSLLSSWTEHYLHTIRNGMYDYRFNSDFAQELQYLSRRSEQELAALNFTLDESQALKTVYRSRYESLQQPESYESAVALAELHEFDEEFEMARYYYLRATDCLDELLERQIGTGRRKKRTQNIFYEVLAESSAGLKFARRQFSWGVARLRLNLLVAMSYERSRDLEQAQAHYRNARTFAASLRRALLNVYDEDGQKFLPEVPDIGRPDYVSTLSNMNLLLQPVFAEAWVAEKVKGGVDTSVGMIERSVWELRWSLPWVKHGLCVSDEARGAESRQHMNFALIMAEQHNKIGDLVFFKGKQVANRQTEDGALILDSGSAGFLAKARYHYTVSLHDTRCFNRARWLAATTKYREAGTGRAGLDTRAGTALDSEHVVEYVLEAAIGSLEDLAEVLLARISLSCLIGKCAKRDHATTVTARDTGDETEVCKDLKATLSLVSRHVRSWLTGGRAPEAEWSTLVACLVGRQSSTNWLDLKGWLGEPERDIRTPKHPCDLTSQERLENQTIRRLIKTEKPSCDLELLANYFAFSFAAARLLEEAGSFEDAAMLRLRMVASINQLLRGALITKGSEVEWATWYQQAPNTSLFQHLAELASELLGQAHMLFVRTQKTFETPDGEYCDVGLDFPMALAIQTIQLALLVDNLELENPRDADFGLCRTLKKIEDWNIPTHDPEDQTESKDHRAKLRNALQNMIVQNPYPMLARLEGLAILIEDHLFDKNCADKAQDQPSKHGDDWEGLLDELRDLEDVYEGTFHFPPTRSGYIHALAYLQKKREATKKAGTERTHLLEAARERFLEPARAKLLESQEMYTMRKSYYRAINNLYYLFDDFNDRIIHYSLAVQMSLSDLTAEMLDRLDESPTGPS